MNNALLSVVLALVLALGGSCPYFHEPGRTQQGQHRGGLGKAEGNESRILDMVLLGNRMEPEVFPQMVSWIIKISIVPPFDEDLEIGLSLQANSKGTVVATCVTPRGASFRSQFKTLRASGKTSEPALAEAVSVNRRVLTEIDSPELRNLSLKLQSLKTTIVLPDELVMDQPKYQFWSQSLWGNRMELVLVGNPGANQAQPLVDWVHQFRDLMLSRGRESSVLSHKFVEYISGLPASDIQGGADAIGQTDSAIVVEPRGAGNLAELGATPEVGASLGPAGPHRAGLCQRAEQHGRSPAVELDKPTVGKWRSRFLLRRLDGLLDEPRPGAPRRVGDAEVERVRSSIAGCSVIRASTCTSPPPALPGLT
jgi:hypothetical protein